MINSRIQQGCAFCSCPAQSFCWQKNLPLFLTTDLDFLYKRVFSMSGKRGEGRQKPPSHVLPLLATQVEHGSLSTALIPSCQCSHGAHAFIHTSFTSTFVTWIRTGVSNTSLSIGMGHKAAIPHCGSQKSCNTAPSLPDLDQCLL